MHPFISQPWELAGSFRKEEAVCVWLWENDCLLVVENWCKIREKVILKRSSLSVSFGQAGRRNMKNCLESSKVRRGMKSEGHSGEERQTHGPL